MTIANEAYAAALSDTRRMVLQAKSVMQEADLIYRDVVSKHPKGTPFAATFQRKPFVRRAKSQLSVLIAHLIHQRTYLEWTRSAPFLDTEKIEFEELKTEWLEAWTDVAIKEIEAHVQQ